MNIEIRTPPSLSTQPIAGLSLQAVWTARLAEVGATPSRRADARVWLDARYVNLSSADLQAVAERGATLIHRGVPISGHLRGASSSPPRAIEEQSALALPHPRAVRVAAQRLRDNHLRTLEDHGVLVVDPSRTLVDPSVQVGQGTILWPDIVLRGHTVLHEQVEVRSGCWVEDCEIGPRSILLPHCVCTGASIGPDCSVGPMAHLRPGAELVADNKVGNFVEVKQATLDRGAKASHLSYLGDAHVGERANIGAGTITCNYDGHRKQRTEIGARAFIGSNTALVAPVRVGEGAIVGAGTVLTKDAPADALAVERGDLRILERMGKKLDERNARRAAAAREAAEGAE